MGWQTLLICIPPSGLIRYFWDGWPTPLLMEPKRYPRQLSRGANNAVIGLSETEVGKLFGGDTRSDIGSEADKMRFANTRISIR